MALKESSLKNIGEGCKVSVETGCQVHIAAW